MGGVLIELENCVRSAFNSTQYSLFFKNGSLIDLLCLVCKWDSTRLIVFACNLLLCTVFEKRTMTNILYMVITVCEMTTEERLHEWTGDVP